MAIIPLTIVKLSTMAADELMAIRHRLGVNQREMAKLLGVDLRSYQHWEYGERNIPGPAVLLARRIADEGTPATAPSPATA